ncbi:Ku protein [Microvirga flavescens]|uniref:non-homologous end joining protein Ku n=1 Tax=Microvirga flavescens TaxID=2249811 RepID=UPI000DD760C9|nr:Ku protein [Microvirga flavescens]
MAPRANWKGYLKLSLVSCAVALAPASTSKDKISFNLLNRKTGNRLRRQMVDEETGETVDGHDQVRGYEIAKREYVTLEDSEIEKVALESTHTIDIESFVPRAQIDEMYLDTPYYLMPDGKVAEEAFAVIRDAMSRKKVVGLGRVVLSRRERIIMLEPRDKGLAGHTLHYAYEVRDSKEYFDEISDVKVSGEMLDLAEHIIEKKITTFDPTRFEDRYQDALIALIKAKAGHKPAPKLEAAKPTNVINLMDALRRSIASDTKPKGAERPARAAAKSAGRSPSKTARTTPPKPPSGAKGGKRLKRTG